MWLECQLKISYAFCFEMTTDFIVEAMNHFIIVAYGSSVDSDMQLR